MYIPNEIICGQKGRPSNNTTVIDPLAYLTYMKVDGEISCKKSFDSWLNKEYVEKFPDRGYSFQEVTYDNTPTSGFTIIKTVGGSSGDIRQAYVRIKDPRGFEFEITDENFISICKTTGVTKGVLNGEFVYAFLDRGRIYLLSTDSPYYESSLVETQKYIEDYNKAKEAPKFSFKNLKKGYSYTVNHCGKHGKTAIYIGKVPVEDYNGVYKNQHLFLLLNVPYISYKQNLTTKHSIEILRNNNIVLENGQSTLTSDKCDEIISNIVKCYSSNICYDILYKKENRTEDQKNYIISVLNEQI